MRDPSLARVRLYDCPLYDMSTWCRDLLTLLWHAENLSDAMIVLGGEPTQALLDAWGIMRNSRSELRDMIEQREVERAERRAKGAAMMKGIR